jgi:hypothetical protein
MILHHPLNDPNPMARLWRQSNVHIKGYVQILFRQTDDHFEQHRLPELLIVKFNVNDTQRVLIVEGEDMTVFRSFHLSLICWKTELGRYQGQPPSRNHLTASIFITQAIVWGTVTYYLGGGLPECELTRAVFSTKIIMLRFL